MQSKRIRSDPEVRRAQILDEAIRIIGERGYYGFAVQDLAKRCGITTGGLLYHFETKEGLLLAVLTEYEHRVEARLMGDRHTGAEASLVAMKSILRAVLAESIAEPELARLDVVLEIEALHPAHPAHAHFQAREARFFAELSAIMTPHCPDPMSATRQLYALLQGLLAQWLRADQGFDIAAEWDRAVVKILPHEED